jgi:ferredoxin--NADP+ reductase
LAEPNMNYFGHVTIGMQDEVSLADLQEIGFDAVLVTVGAQGTKWLGLDGEKLTGVYHAKDLVYHYNQLPPFSNQEYLIGKRVVCVGVGNVMLDIANWTVRDLKIDKITAIARRGPADVKFTKKEMSLVFANLDLAELDSEVERTAPIMQAVGQDPQAAKDFILSAGKRMEEANSDTVFTLEFLTSPLRIVGDEHGRVRGLEVEDTTLALRDDGVTTRAISQGTTRVIECDTVVFCIGDSVDTSLGLPLDKWKEFAKHPAPRFAIKDISYEAYDPQTDTGVEGVFLAGWAREASSGLVGAARKDGQQSARAVLAYLETLPYHAGDEDVIQALEQRLADCIRPVVCKTDWERLELAEQKRCDEHSLELFKFSSNTEMLAVMGLNGKPPAG